MKTLKQIARRYTIAVFLAAALISAAAMPVYAINNTPPQLTIRFAPNPGYFPEGVSGVRTGVKGFRIAEFPEPVPPQGYTFIGWFSEGEKLSAPVAAVRSMTILAGYAPDIPEGAPRFAVMFDPGPGELPEGTPPIQPFTYGSALVSLPTPTLEGYSFAGWQFNGYMVAAPYIVRGEMVLEAAWQAAPPAAALRPIAIPAGQFVAAFNPAPGAFTGDETGIRFGRAGARVDDLPDEPVRLGYVFIGWATPMEPLVLREDIHLTAIWAAADNTTASGTLHPPPVDTRPNPLTSPTTISFMILGAVLLLGVAAGGIYWLSKKQLAAEGNYHAYITRTVREMKLLIRNRPR